jgi:hypothetical protein
MENLINCSEQLRLSMDNAVAPRISLILSFDYELSLGGASHYERNLFAPTDKLIELAQNLSVPLNLFTDILCLSKFREWEETSFCERFERQTQDALKAGHDVQLHIHPHWIDTEFRGGRFVPSSKYSLGYFAEDPPPHDIRGIVSSATTLLTELCRRQVPEYRCVAFRAGGYSLTPHTSQILSALYESGIRIDSSIAKGFVFRSGLYSADFRNMPKAPNWIIPLQGPLNSEADEGLFEIPIASVPRTPWNNLPFLVKRVLYKKRAYSSGGVGLDAGHVSAFQKFQRMFPRTAWMLSFDNYTMNAKSLVNILQKHAKASRGYDHIICSAIAHPKSMGAYSLQLMADFVKRVQDMKPDFGVEFTTYRHIAESLDRECSEDNNP